MATGVGSRAGEALQRALVVLLALLLLAIGLVLFPGALPVAARHRLGLDTTRSTTLPAASGSYAFMQQQPGTTVPVTYSRCQTLHYVINPNGIPDGFRDAEFIHSAVVEVSRVSGLEFHYDGTTTMTRAQRSQGQGPILFDFAEAADQPMLEGKAGYGGRSCRAVGTT